MDIEELEKGARHNLMRFVALIIILVASDGDQGRYNCMEQKYK